MVNNENFLLKENIYYVYAFYDNLHVPFYIGMGRGNRMIHHLRPCIRYARKAFFYNKLNKLIENEIDFSYKKLVENLSLEEAVKIESQFISAFGRLDLKTGSLCNLTDGGEGHKNYKRSRETIERVRLKNTGRKRTDEFKLNASIRMTGRKLSAETRLKISLVQKGTKKPKPISSLPNYKAAAQLKVGNPEFAKKVSESQRTKNAIGILQINPETNNIIKTWDNQYDAAKEVGSVGHGIVAAARIGRKHKHFKWKFND